MFNAKSLTNISIAGYKLFSAYCQQKHEHRGTAIFASSLVAVKPMNKIWEFAVEMHIECGGVEVKYQHGKHHNYNLQETRLSDLLFTVQRFQSI